MLSLKAFSILAIHAIGVTAFWVNSWFPILLLAGCFGLLAALLIPILLQPRRARLAREKAREAKLKEENQKLKIENLFKLEMSPAPQGQAEAQAA